MPSDSFSSLNPSDSGLLNGPVPPHVNSGAPQREKAARADLPDPPAPKPVDYDDPEESLRDVPLPEGFLGRLRRFVNDL